MKQKKFVWTACALAACATLGDAWAEEASAPSSIVVTGKRTHRISSGATNLPLDIKETPQSISTLERQEIADWGVTGSNDALRLATGITVEEWETNRTNFKVRGFDVMLTQVDGMGLTNEWGIATGKVDTYLFERIELVRGANGLLTGVGNASGTINYVRKRPTNKDGGEAVAAAGSHDFGRLAVDYNKVFTEDGAWAGRLVVAQEDTDSHLRGLHDRRGSVYGVVDGQIGDAGMLTIGFTHQDSKTRGNMWGSLTLPYADGTLADFPVESSTAQDWTRWNTRTDSAFIEYTHTLWTDWEAKLTYSHREGTESTKLFYAYSLSGTLDPDNTGLVGWPYRSQKESSTGIVDARLAGRFGAFGRRHDLVLGVSHSKQKDGAESFKITSPAGPALPAFPYGGDVYPEPTWGDTTSAADGRQKFTRLYAATRLQLADKLKGIVGVNGIRLKRDGTSIYGGGVALDNEKTEKFSPYVGLVFEATQEVNAYASYSDIFQVQDQRDVHGQFLAPMKGVNAEVGVKAEWLDHKLLTTLAVFTAEQKGLATEAGFDREAQRSWYAPRDVKSRGFEVEATGRIGADTKLTAGYTHLRLTGADGNDNSEWIPRRTFKLRTDTRLPMLPDVRLGAAVRWQSDVSKIGGARQDSYLVASAFAAYDITDSATLRLNVDNLFDKKYLRTVEFGAIYGAPRSATMALEYKL